MLPDNAPGAGSTLREPARIYRAGLILILALRIVSYYMVSDDLAFVQAFKALSRIFLTVILMAAIFAESRPGHRFLGQVRHRIPVWLYGVYLGLGAASLLWTTGFIASLQQWMMDAEGFVFAALFAGLLGMYHRRHPGGYFGLHKILAPAVLLHGIGFFTGRYLHPDLFYRLTHGGSVSRLGGYIINPNELGMLLVVGIACFLPLLVKEGQVRISVILSLGLLIYLLLLTGSRSSFAGLLLVLCVYALTGAGRVQRALVFGGTLALIPIAGWSFFVKQDQLTELFTLTGRLPFWRDLLTYNFPQEPWLGYGYMRIDYADKFESIHAYAGAMTHNTFLQVLLGLGLTGLMLVLIQLSLFLHTMFRVENMLVRRTACLIFIPLLVNSFTEFGIFGETNFGILFYLLLLFSVSRETLYDPHRIKKGIHHETTTRIPHRPAYSA